MDKALSVIGLALAALQAALPLEAPAPLRLGAAALSIVLVPAASPAARGLLALLACLAAAMLAPLPAMLGVFSWPARMAAALLTWSAVARAHPPVRASAGWRAWGRVPLLATLAIGGVTPVALGGWLALMRPDLSDVARAVPPAPLAALAVGAAAFALLNATLEELVWRGALQDRLAPTFAPHVAVALQAASFGAQHAHGVPRGLVGVALAGAWAVMLGALRRHAGGLLAPVIAHVMADVTIAVIVLVYVR